MATKAREWARASAIAARMDNTCGVSRNMLPCAPPPMSTGKRSMQEELMAFTSPHRFEDRHEQGWEESAYGIHAPRGLALDRPLRCELRRACGADDGWRSRPEER